jgi:hypothetical protein
VSPSRAASAAAAASHKRPAGAPLPGASSKSLGAEPARATRALVEKSALVFEHLFNLPPYETEAIQDGVRTFLRFVERVETGQVDDDARALAALVVQRGYAWLEQHPHLLPVPTSLWTLDMVERAIILFNERSHGEPEPHTAEELVADLRVFETVVSSGCVERGDAEHLASAFVEYAHRWLRGHPAVMRRYESLL